MKHHNTYRAPSPNHKIKTMFFSKLKNAIRDAGGRYTYTTISDRFLKDMKYRISYATLRDNGIVFDENGFAKLK